MIKYSGPFKDSYGCDIIYIYSNINSTDMIDLRDL